MDPINKIYPLYVSSQKKPAPAGSVMGNDEHPMIFYNMLNFVNEKHD